MMKLNLNQELIEQCNNQSMYNRGTHIEKVANEIYQEFISCFENEKYNLEQKEIYENRKNLFKKFLEREYNNYLLTASKYVPVNIAGPANYPADKQNKILERLIKQEKDTFNKVENFKINTKKMLDDKIPLDEIIKKYQNGYDAPISGDDPNAREKLLAKLEYLENQHQKYKDFNKEARINGEKQLPSYVLANSNQNIRSIKERINKIERINNLNDIGYYFRDGKVSFDKNANRVKIFFDDIPTEEVRKILKSNGYKWSPKSKAWQRKLTPQAISRTKYLFKDIGSLTANKVMDNIEEKNINI